MDFGLKDKLVLVTGSSRGIGKGIAGVLAKEGARVVLVARDANNLKAVQAELVGGAKKHPFYAVDLTIDKDLQKFATDVVKDNGEPDVIVHNLGGSLGVTDPLASAADWSRVWHYNMAHVIELNRIFLPLMIKKKWGRVIHLSTLATTTFQGNAAYVSAKMALNGYVKIVGRHVAKHNVILSAVAPGAIMIEGRHFSKLQKENPKALEEYYQQHLPAWRLGTPEDVGQAVAFLCSEQAGFMTGSIVGIDGGGM
jgi:3-oxoacyl-[acyl-carrier protein] reductase